ncbi:putative enzyme related to lactoylglutathione lyase [Paenibacillus castaneae]|uniref:VOC family protein n=1 Tax=Paenibacillus castaneae TaxID=474957 RepID=UPI000C9A7762|nr:VOC family protein [Paenibacillus castaneae]NIK75377.1 putative enzyme related to lactoylglutathione lyase [Paenibacillus castaneae]
MSRKMGYITILVKEYEEAITFYKEKLGFELITDNSFGGGIRWVTVAPSSNNETAIVLVRADTDEKLERLGSQAANHVFLVIHTDDCRRDYEQMKSRGVHFLGEPKDVPWGVEVVFEDLYGNRFDLVQHNGL